MQVATRDNGHGCTWVIVTGEARQYGSAAAKAGAKARNLARGTRRKAYRITSGTSFMDNGTRFEERVLYAFQ